MAPDLALDRLVRLNPGSIVLDPMAGSGTVLQEACALGHQPLGFDLDPLAVLMSRIATAKIDDGALTALGHEIATEAAALTETPPLPWIDEDEETSAFVSYWFGEEQRRDLRKLAFCLHEKRREGRSLELQALELALSRLIIVKEKGASLARDIAHSRPHRVADEIDYEVLPKFVQSVAWVRKRLIGRKLNNFAQVELGDCRNLPLADGSVSGVVTSPPYLNAIDYMRGHRMALVWLGFKVGDLRKIRASAIGAERQGKLNEDAELVRRSMGNVESLPANLQGMINRYVSDLLAMMKETKRVLQQGSEATFVIGNSCLRGIFINNAEGLVAAGRCAGLSVSERFDRDLPMQHRYLPLSQGSLAKRMRIETILSLG